MRSVSLAEQAREVERIYQGRRRFLQRPMMEHERSRWRVRQRRQDALLAAWHSLAWLAAHPAVLRGYLEFCKPMVEHSEDWVVPPEF